MDEEKLRFRKYEMALLFHQTCSIHNLLTSQIEYNEPINYFIVNKNSLDEFKHKFNYINAVEYFKVCQKNNKLTYKFETFNEKISKNLGESKAFCKKYKESDSIFKELEFINIENNFKEKICFIKEKFLKVFANDLSKINPYPVYFRNNKILIEYNNKLGFCLCEIEENENLDFCIKINNHYQFDLEEETTKHINEFIENNGNIEFDNDNDNNNEICNEENKRITNLVMSNNSNQLNINTNFNDYVLKKNMNNNMNNILINSNNNIQNMNITNNFINNSTNPIMQPYDMYNQRNYEVNNNVSNSYNDIYNNIYPSNSSNGGVNMNNYSQFNNMNTMTPNGIINQGYQNNFVMQNNSINNQNYMNNNQNGGVNSDFMNGNPNYTNQNNYMNPNNFPQFSNTNNMNNNSMNNTNMSNNNMNNNNMNNNMNNNIFMSNNNN